MPEREIDVIYLLSCQAMRGNDWNLTLSNTHYILILHLPNLPFSEEEVYEIHTTVKDHDLQRYKGVHQTSSSETVSERVKPDVKD